MGVAAATNTPLAGESFDAITMLGISSDELKEYSGIETGTEIVNGEPFKETDFNKMDLDLLNTKLSIPKERLALYDMDTVAGLVAIAKAMQAVEEGTADDKQKDLLTHADDFFSQLYACCLETETKLDGESVAGAVKSYKNWLEGKNPDETQIVKIGIDGKEQPVKIKDQFSPQQQTLLDDKFKNADDGEDKVFSATEDKAEIGDSVFDVTVQATSAAGEDDGGDNNTGGGNPNDNEDEHDDDQH